MEPITLPTKGLIKNIDPGSLAETIGLQPGDTITHVNGHPVADVIDVQFYAAEDYVEFDIWRGQQEYLATGQRQPGQFLGITFEHPTFDTDIRRCNNLCPFCFVLQMPPRMRRPLYIKDDDYRYSFLHGHYVTLTNLSDHDWWRIEHQHLSPLYISVHATDLETRRKCLRNPTAPDIMPQLRWLAQRGIQCHTQLVITPGLNDGPHLDQSIQDLITLWPAVRSVSIVPVGLTRHHKYGHRPNTTAEANTILDRVHAWQTTCRPKLGVNFVYATDEWYLITGRNAPPQEDIDGLELHENGLGQVRYFLDQWAKEQTEIDHRWAGRQATLATGTLFAPTLQATTRQLNTLAKTRLRVHPITNHHLGSTITVAGLLTGQDIITQLQGQPLGDFVALPRVMFDHPQSISLDNISPHQIAQALQTPVILADLMGDILDALDGTNPLTFDLAQTQTPPTTTKPGGWSLEKRV